MTYTLLDRKLDLVTNIYDELGMGLVSVPIVINIATSRG